MKQNKLYADMFLSDYSLGQDVPREIFYYKAKKWRLVDNSKGKCRIIPFENEEACMAYFKSLNEIEKLISELEYLKGVKNGS